MAVAVAMAAVGEIGDEWEDYFLDLNGIVQRVEAPRWTSFVTELGWSHYHLFLCIARQRCVASLIVI